MPARQISRMLSPATVGHELGRVASILIDGNTYTDNTSIDSALSNMPRGRSVGRAIVRRWPALAVATVAAAMPVIALASGPAFFEGGLGQAAVTAYNVTAYGVALHTTGMIEATGGTGKAMYAESTGSRAVEVSNHGYGDGLHARSIAGHAIVAETEQGLVDPSQYESALKVVSVAEGAEIEGKNGYGLSVRGTTEGIRTVGKTGLWRKALPATPSAPRPIGPLAPTQPAFRQLAMKP
jgi:hypothetical protein